MKAIATDPTSIEIPRTDRMGRDDFFREYGSKNEPVVITGLFDDCPARRLWTFDWFKEHHGAEDIEVVPTSGRRVDYAWSYVPRKLGEYMDLVQREPSTPYYMAESRLFEQVPSLGEYVPWLPHFPKDRKIDRRLWLGPASTFSHYHKDNHLPFARIASLFMQVAGQKRFTLVSPLHDDMMYPEEDSERTLENNYAYQSPIDRDYPDYDRFPKYRDAALHEAVVEPGDCLYIPAGWWHYVRALTPSISLSNWWLESRIVELVGRLLNSPDPAPILAEYGESLAVQDVAEFYGGPKLMKAALRMVSDEKRSLVLRLFSPQARDAVSSLLGD